MSVTENEFETLELWLDGELSADQIEVIQRRVAGDPDLAVALDRLRHDRQMRMQVWQAMEPNKQEIQTLAARASKSIQTSELRSMRWHAFGKAVAMAASVAIIFSVGWISSQRLHVGAQPQVTIVNAAPAGQERVVPQVILDPAGPARIVQTRVGSDQLATASMLFGGGGGTPQPVSMPQRFDLTIPPNSNQLSNVRPTSYTVVLYQNGVPVVQRAVEGIADPHLFMTDIARLSASLQFPSRLDSNPVNVTPNFVSQETPGR
jgi:hypothetical protein